MGCWGVDLRGEMVRSALLHDLDTHQPVRGGAVRPTVSMPALEPTYLPAPFPRVPPAE